MPKYTAQRGYNAPYANTTVGDAAEPGLRSAGARRRPLTP